MKRSTSDTCFFFKKGKRSDRNNYRPDNSTSTCCKIMETIVRERESKMAQLVTCNVITNMFPFKKILLFATARSGT